jgi:hypothetical protein
VVPFSFLTEDIKEVEQVFTDRMNKKPKIENGKFEEGIQMRFEFSLLNFETFDN